MPTLARREGESLYLFIDGMEPIRIMLSTVNRRRRRASIAVEAANS